MVELYNDVEKLKEVIHLLGKRNEADSFAAFRLVSSLLKEKAEIIEEYERQLDAEYAIIEAGRGEGQVA